MKLCVVVILTICTVVGGLVLPRPQQYSAVSEYLRKLAAGQKSHVTLVAEDQEVTLVNDIMNVLAQVNTLTFGVANLKKDKIRGKKI